MAALTVLVVEDDALIGMLLAEMLEDMGHNVASDGPPEPYCLKTCSSR